MERAKSYREEIDDALEAARRYDWFGAHVVEVVRGLGWSRGLSETTHKAIWEHHEVAAKVTRRGDQHPSRCGDRPGSGNLPHLPCGQGVRREGVLQGRNRWRRRGTDLHCWRREDFSV